ncbi:hypothetical protein Vretimale_16212 [Volvox reticuliferus]|uniref:Uncharacterized protein n=1 Tax=Volvox reticuliferus TaxID=1737510 RepID=A0A8J4GQK1_9CHLO|nr:hypothetical protein Vretifemale_16947 [Volvox reticuliferus]GIM13003.1 hypothetical protein Vretimale_16212 [Volvox reticuliferus]
MSVTTRLTDDDAGRQGTVLPLGLSPNDVNCPICVETISDPFVTSCGHTFCYQCVSTQLKHKNSCPSCGGYLTTDNIYPNFLLNKILRKAATARPPGRCSLVDQVQRLLADNMVPDPPASRSLLLTHPVHHHNLQSNSNLYSQGLAQAQGQSQGVHPGHHNAAAAAKGTPPWALAAPQSGGNGSGRLRLRLRDIDAVLAALYEAREELERRESSDALHLLLCFLQDAREHKARQMAELRKQLAVLEEDILAATVAVGSAAAHDDGGAGAANDAGVVAGDDGDGEADLGAVPQALRGEEVEGSMAAAPLPLLLQHHETGPSSAMGSPHPQRPSAGPSGTWLRRALPHLHPDGARQGSGGAVDGAVDALAASPPPAPAPPLLQDSDQHPTHQEGRGSEPEEDLEEQQQRRRQRLGHRVPPRRASWYLHTITPAGGISSVTIDTSSLHEPGQQAEAFGAAMRHALAAATGAGGGGGSGSAASAAAAAAATGSVSVSDAFGIGGGLRHLQQAPDCDADMDSVGQTTTTQPRLAPVAEVVTAGMPAECEESGNAMAAGSTASGPRDEETEAATRRAEVGAAAAAPPVVAACRTRQREASGGGGGGAGGLYGSSAAASSGRHGMLRCGSADNFMLLGGHATTAAGTLVAATAATGSQPSASGDVAAASGGGEDASALSGAAFPPPTDARSTDMRQRRQQPPGSPAVTVTLGLTGAATAATAAGGTAAAPSPPRLQGADGTGASGAATIRQACQGRVDEKKKEEAESEDEMDVRERRKGRGRPPSQQPRLIATATAATGGGMAGGINGVAQPLFQPSGGCPTVAVLGSCIPCPITAADTAAAGGAGSWTRGGGGDALEPVRAQATARMKKVGELTATVGVGSGHTEAADAAAAEEDLAAVHLTKRRRMLSQFGLLEQCYIQMRVARKPAAVSGGILPRTHNPHGTARLSADAGTRTHAFSSRQHRHLTLELQGKPPPATAAAAASYPLLPLLGGLAGGACSGAHPHRGPSGPDGRCNCDGNHGDGGDQDLDTFGAVLAAATQYSRLELLAEIPRHGSASGNGTGSAAGGGGGGLQILSSIEFDLSDDLFATAGVVPRILVYDYQALLSGKRPPRPATELTARSKLSCLSYSRGVRQHLLAADYLGGVALWDTEAGMQVQDHEAHERRVWGVDFNPVPSYHHCFASGSDDGLVKIWSTRQAHSCMVLELRGNVCSVEWHPTHPHLLAVGSALHCAAVYDIRQPAVPLHTLLGHRRAVSYVRWLSNRHELVSASTDSTLKLWSLSPPPPPPPPPFPPQPSATAAINTLAFAADPGSGAVTAPATSPSSSLHGAELVRTFSGHVNERNFVGLATDGDYLACGSESHEVFVYHRSLPQPALTFSFSSRMHELERSGAVGPHPPYPQHSHFVTALQWRRNSPHLLVANSTGCIWLMGLKLL